MTRTVEERIICFRLEETRRFTHNMTATAEALLLIVKLSYYRLAKVESDNRTLTSQRLRSVSALISCFRSMKRIAKSISVFSPWMGYQSMASNLPALVRTCEPPANLVPVWNFPKLQLFRICSTKLWAFNTAVVLLFSWHNDSTAT